LHPFLRAEAFDVIRADIDKLLTATENVDRSGIVEISDTMIVGTAYVHAVVDAAKLRPARFKVFRGHRVITSGNCRGAEAFHDLHLLRRLSASKASLQEPRAPQRTPINGEVRSQARWDVDKSA